MARKKNTTVIENGQEEKKDRGQFGESSKYITKLFGEDIIVSGNRVVEHKKEVVPFSPALDSALGGGIQTGSVVMLAGPPRCGKTVSSLSFAAEWQKKPKPGKVVFIAAESRLESRDLLGIKGLDPNKMIVIQSTKGKVMTAQDYLMAAETCLRLEENILLIIDSVSILMDQREFDGGITTEIRGGPAKLMATFCRAVAPTVPMNENVLICIAHTYANVTGYGKNYIVSSGTKLQYQLSTLIVCEQSVKPWLDDDGNQVGQIVPWVVGRTPLGPPNIAATSYIKYGTGIDRIQETIYEAIPLTIIIQSGSWYKINLPGESEKGVQGAAKLYNYLVENPKTFQKIEAAIRDISLPCK